MGVYNSITITSGDLETRLDSLATYLNSLDGITAERYNDEDWDIGWDPGYPQGVKYSFDGTNISCFFGYYREMIYTAEGVKKDDAYILKTTHAPYVPTGTPLVVHSYIDDNCKLITIKDTCPDRGGLTTVMLTIGNTKLVGYKSFYTASNNVTFVDISSLTFEEISDPVRIPYTYTNMFPYAAPAGQLDFINQAYFVNGNSVKKFTTDLLKECSAVNLLSSASLPAPLGNFIAIGAHCLAPLDEEGGDE